MKLLKLKHVGLSMLAVCAASFAQVAGAAGILTPKNAQYTPAEIREHHVNVVIQNGFAVTSVEQVFYNPNTSDLEATYAFPIPEKASVGEFTYWIDGKPVTAEVVEKKRAREIYEQEKAAGRETAITEKNEYKTFDSTVYPVRAQQEVRIRLVYLQPTHMDSGIGRYVYPLEDGGVDTEQLDFWSYQEHVKEAFSFNVTLKSGYPLDGVRVPNPGATINKISDQEWNISLASGTTTSEEGTPSSSQGTTVYELNEDLVVYWRLKPGLPGGVDLATYRAPGESEGTFMLTLTPGNDLEYIQQGRDWVFVLDFSGSMEGKYSSLVEGVKQGLGKLRPEDRFRIFLFNDRAREITNGFQPVTMEIINTYSNQLTTLHPDGGTNLYEGLESGLKSADRDRTTAIVLVTDGVANVGRTEKQDFLKLLDKKDIRLFTFVMGNSANRPLLEGMTRVSEGFAMNVSSSDDILGKVMLAADKLTHEAFRDIDVRINGIKVTDLSPEVPGSLYRGQQLTLFGHYWGDGIASLDVTARAGTDDIHYKADLSFPASNTLNPELERLWAYASIQTLLDEMAYLGEDSDRKQAITDLAIEYGLLTDYTSLLVVREELFEQYKLDRNNQKRVDNENQARQQRAATPPTSLGQSTGPALSQPQAYPSNGGSGGGAINPWMILLLLPLLFIKTSRTQ